MPPKERINKIPFQRGNAAPALKKAYVDQNIKSPPIIAIASSILADSSSYNIKSGAINSYPTSSYYSNDLTQNKNPTTYTYKYENLELPTTINPITEMINNSKYIIIGGVVLVLLMISKKK